MHFRNLIRSAGGASALAAVCAAPLAAASSEESSAQDDITASGTQETFTLTAIQSPAGQTVENSPPPVPLEEAAQDSVFDETWLTVGIGAGYVPSYSGSDDYVVFPLPLVAGRVGGVGIRPAAAGVTLDLLSPGLAAGRAEGTQFSLGPTIRVRNDRVDRIEDPVVEAAGELDTAIELGLNAGVSFPGVLNPFDTLSIGGSVRHDILGAHDGMLIEPNVTYFTPVSRAAIVTLSAGVQFVDDDFADYYYSVSPAQSAASGLPEFEAEGGLNSYGVNMIAAYDLDGDALNGGFSVFGIGSYSRLVNDGADTPFTATRGSADQWVGGIGLGYTF